MLLHGGISIAQILHYIYGILYCRSDMRNMPNCTPIWFLMSLFFTSILYWAVEKRLRNRTWIAALCSMGIGYALSILTDFSLPLKLDTIFTAMFFMWVGHQLRQIEIMAHPLQASLIGYAGILLEARIWLE